MLTALSALAWLLACVAGHVHYYGRPHHGLQHVRTLAGGNHAEIRAQLDAGFTGVSSIPGFGKQQVLPGVPTAVVNLTGPEEFNVRGKIVISQWDVPFVGKHIRIHGRIIGLTSGLHGFHIHQSGATGEDCKAAGGHFNPAEVKHGARCKAHTTSTPPFFSTFCPSGSTEMHAGDLGNIFTFPHILQIGDTVTDFDMTDTQLTLGDGSETDIAGRAVVLHLGEDDLGQGKGEKKKESQKTGNAGARVACGVIEMQEPSTFF